MQELPAFRKIYYSKTRKILSQKNSKTRKVYAGVSCM